MRNLALITLGWVGLLGSAAAARCWNGDPKQANAYSRLHYNFQYLPQILERIKTSAPPGADLKSWRY